MNQQDFKDDLERMAQLWDKAQETGAFKDKQEFVPSQQTSTDSFFGLKNTNPSDTVSDVDAKYWANINDMVDNVPMTMMQEQNAKNVDVIKKKVAGIASTPNPVRQTTVGKDQDLTDPATLDASYDEDDINKIAELKEKLHALQDKLNSAEGSGSKIGSLASQISELSDKIDELSDALGKPPQISPGG